MGIQSQEYQEVILEFCLSQSSIATIVVLNKELTGMYAGMRCPNAPAQGCPVPSVCLHWCVLSLLIPPFSTEIFTHIHPDHFRSCQAIRDLEKFMQTGIVWWFRAQMHPLLHTQWIAQWPMWSLPDVRLHGALDHVTILLFLWSRFLAPGSSKSKLII